MTAIRFIQKNNGGNSIHRYITDLSDREAKKVWDLMMIEETDGHFFYEDPQSGRIEYPKPDVEYREIPVEKADLFIPQEPGWEIALRRRERAPLNLRPQTYLARFPDEHAERVVFKKKAVEV